MQKTLIIRTNSYRNRKKEKELSDGRRGQETHMAFLMFDHVSHIES